MGICLTKSNISEAHETVVAPRLLGSKPPTPSKQFKELKDGAMSRDMFIIDRSSAINKHYSIDKTAIGEGSFGSVSLARNKQTGSSCAVKTMAKRSVKDVASFRREIQTMKLMDHPGVVKLYETFEDNSNIYLVMEVCRGGELFAKIIDVKSFTEKQAAILMQQAIGAVRHMHEHRICHRDLKPENFLFLNKGPIETNILKIIDFGLSTRFEYDKPLRTKAGTPYYVAPEVLSGRYNHQVDLWSCGIIMYVMLCGYPPFYGNNDSEVLNAVRDAPLVFKGRIWKHVSTDAQHLISNLLNRNPRSRYSADQALNDDWIKHTAPKAEGVSLKADILDNLRSFQAASHFKKAALTVIAGRLSEEQISELRQAFVAMDLNCDGLLSMSEMRKGLAKAGLSKLPADFEKLMDDVDADGNGRINYTEFLAATLDKKLYLQEKVVREAFNVFDLNGDGQIAPDELKKVLCSGSVQEAVGIRRIEDIVLQVDNNGDGTIDFDEFMHMMQQNCSPSKRRSTAAV